MQITCPNCATRYVIDASKIGSAGRKVKCARCGHQWSVQADPTALANAQAAAAKPARRPAPPPSAPDPDPVPAPNPTDALSPAVEPPSTVAETRAPAEPEAVRPTPEAALHPRREVGRDRINLPATTTLVPAQERRQIVWWAVLALLLGGVIATVLSARNTVITHWPPAVQLYDALGLPVDRSLLGDYGNPLASFEFGALDTRIIPRSGREYLVIMGTITNEADVELTVPTLQLMLLDTQGQSVGEYPFRAEMERLPAGATGRFETEIVGWDPAAASVEVTAVRAEP